VAGFKANGLDELVNSFEMLAEMPDEVILSMLDAQADVVEKAQIRTAGTMLSGRYSKGLVQGAVKKTEPIKSKSGAVQFITFDGIARGKRRPRKGNRIAEIAFINEFGKTNQPARPFIQTANEESAEAATQAAAGVHDEYLKSIGL